MKVRAESLGSGFYLSLFLMVLVALLWMRLEPQRLDPDVVNQIVSRKYPRTHNPITKAQMWIEGVDFPPPSASRKDFRASLDLLRTRTQNSSPRSEHFFNDLLRCSLSVDRSMEQRLQCATLATELNKGFSQKFKAELGEASQKWPSEIQEKTPIQF